MSTERSTLLRRERDEEDGPPWAYQDDTAEAMSRSVNQEDSLEASDPHGLDHSRNSNLSSLMNVLKGNLGTGILAMPVAVKNLGFLLGPLTILAIGCIATHCMHLLVRSAQHLRRMKRVAYLDYSQVMHEATLQRFPRREKLANVLRLFVNASLLITQIGFCCVYILFVSDNLHQLIDCNLKPGQKNWDVTVYKVLVMLALVPYVFVRNLRLLSYFSMLANVLTAVGLVIVFAYCVQDLPDYRNYQLIKSPSLWPIAFGLIIFAFEGISLVLPIESRMLRPQEFGGLTGVLQLGMTIVMSSYTAVGFYGYLKFNENVQASITYSINDHYWIYQLIRPLFAVSLYLSYGLQFYVPAVIIVGWANTRFDGQWQKRFAEAGIRIGLVLFTFIAAVVVPHLDLMIALIGAFSSSCLALIFPPIVDWLLSSGPATAGADERELTNEPEFNSPSTGSRYCRHLKNIAIVTFGMLGFAIGTVTTLISIVQTFQQSSNATTPFVCSPPLHWNGQARLEL